MLVGGGGREGKDGGRGCALFLGLTLSPFAQLEQAFQVAVNTTLGAMSLEPNRKEVEDYINKVSHVLHWPAQGDQQ